MKQTSMEIKQNQVLWRKDQVLRLAADGYTEREIAAHLKISDTTIHRDLTLLKQQAKEHIHKYITDQVPFEYKKTLAGLEGIIKNMSNIITNSTDNKEIMQASGIKMQALNMKMEMVAGANLVEEAIDLVERYQSKIQGQGSTTQNKEVVRDDSSKSS